MGVTARLRRDKKKLKWRQSYRTRSKSTIIPNIKPHFLFSLSISPLSVFFSLHVQTLNPKSQIPHVQPQISSHSTLNRYVDLTTSSSSGLKSAYRAQTWRRLSLLLRLSYRTDSPSSSASRTPSSYLLLLPLVPPLALGVDSPSSSSCCLPLVEPRVSIAASSNILFALVNDAYAFLHNWFVEFPSYRRRAFYIAGESYAGKYVPVLAELIQDKNKDPSLYIDLKGILLGNPETSDSDDWRGMADYAWSHAVISDETHRIIGETCDFASSDPWSNVGCSHAVDEMLTQYNEIDIYNLYTSVCIGNKTKSENGSQQQQQMPRIMGGYDPCLDSSTEAFYNRPNVQRALHVSDGYKLRKWSMCNYTMFNNWNYTKPTVLPIYRKLIVAGLRIWVYSGDTDGRVPVLSTRYSIDALGLPITKAWSPWYHEEQVSGWYQEYQGLTFLTLF